MEGCQSCKVILDLGGTAGICSPHTLSIVGHPNQQHWRCCSCLEPSQSRWVLTEAALSPVVVGQAVITLGPRGAFPALTVAGLVAAVVHGPDLVAVTFCPKRQGGHSLSCLGSCACSSLREGLGAWESLEMCCGGELRDQGAGRTHWPKRPRTVQTAMGAKATPLWG